MGCEDEVIAGVVERYDFVGSTAVIHYLDRRQPILSDVVISWKDEQTIDASETGRRRHRAPAF